MNVPAKRLKVNIIQSVVVLFTFMAIVATVFCNSAFAESPGEGAVIQKEVEQKKTDVEAVKYGLIAASIAFGFGAIGAGIAIAHVGAAAMGAVAEKPEIAGQALIFVALAEGIVIFGFITALMILGKV